MIHSRRIPRRHTGAGKVINAVVGIAAIICGIALVSLFTPVSATAAAQDDWDGWTQGPFHYTGKYCMSCHDSVPVEKEEIRLKYAGDYNLLCKCHNPERYAHPVNIAPSDALSSRIPDQLPLEEGKVTCLTCHDIHRQCSSRRFRTDSVRGAPYRNRLAFCYRCHDPSAYQAFNPHNQRMISGEIDEETCLYCHVTIPNKDGDTYDSLEYVGDMVNLCQRCHRIDGKHAGNVKHLVKPSAKLLAVMKKMETDFNIILPLDREGKLTCITCHNPHDKGVIPDDRRSARGAGSKFRHRLPERLCIECHRL